MSSGVPNWLCACKIMLEALFLIAGHDIDEWVVPEVDAGASSPATKVKRTRSTGKFKKPSAKKSTPRYIYSILGGF